ncbi:hypothetical protein PENANT_c026G08187 [Penicillium antarcticum]|uniref:PH domain-containing protein n=1 Tax=Penicillium antarcticum TaxID=416450 RepID=A0A1V6PWZ2_9EURO|nr:uncharacterized protein N7508_000083 [Penicillium antarcticum]KAJ5319800.1 hypothetical protein N7508_000083 [Penicillium antarcticum]OQD81548.1 hypothetical protein PENANT_c026G08187 [Penicillium antarcticum]
MNPDAQSFGERRGHRLAPLQTNFSRPTASSKSQSRLQRPRPTDYPSTNGSEGPVPLQSPVTVKRQSSKTSLRNLFGRDKSSRVPEPKLEEVDESLPEPQTAIFSEVPMSPSLMSPRTIESAPTITSPKTAQRPRATLKTARPRPQEGNLSKQDQYGWKPPPLFQAYPQSTKHDTLSAPALSADSILRLHAMQAKNSTDGGTVNALEQDEAANAARKKREQKERKHLRTLSGTINKVEWMQKIYVLATAGYILQYAGDGKHDRLPEKMLLLGPSSVAFASDAIPGKHWVLQVSHNPSLDPNSIVPEPPKPRFSRFGFPRSNTRRFAGSFLLIFDNPDAMIGWLTAVREEIEKRGGPKLTQEKHSEDEIPQLRSKSSIRQMVKKDPHRISSLFLQPQTLQSPTEEDDGQSVGGTTWQSRRSSYVSVNRRSIIESRSGSVSTSRTEATNPANGSGISSVSDLRSSSFTSNVPTSPVNGGFISDEPLPEEAERHLTRSPPSSSHGVRLSVYTSPLPPLPIKDVMEDRQAPSPPVPENLIRCASPPAPNFSVPSFSKKFVPRGGPVSTSQASPPLSGNAFSRRADQADPNMSTFSSPPQSPTFSVASSRHTDSSEPRRILRVSNSEDALARTVRSTQNSSIFSRMPRAPPPTGPLPDPTASSRPSSIVGRPGMSPQASSEPHVPTAPAAAPPADPAPRNRVSTVYPDNHPFSISRRKSMPGLGLSIGPAAPPPNCPLPKLPSLMNPAGTAAATPAPAPAAVSSPQMLSPLSPTSPMERFYGSQPVRDHVEDCRVSGNKPGAPTAQTKPHAKVRHSKLVKGPPV